LIAPNDILPLATRTERMMVGTDAIAPFIRRVRSAAGRMRPSGCTVRGGADIGSPRERSRCASSRGTKKPLTSLKQAAQATTVTRGWGTGAIREPRPPYPYRDHYTRSRAFPNGARLREFPYGVSPPYRSGRFSLPSHIWRSPYGNKAQ
jgi:hypothetical protein